MSLEEYKKIGKITAEAREYGKSLIKKGISLKEVCDKVDEKIYALGAKPAFPSQISLNEVAAHYCPEDDDPAILDDQLVSLDVGAHINGIIGDSAVTVDLSGNHKDLVKASEEALKAALEVVGIGVELRKIGKAIQETVEGFGFKPVRNLSGHGLGLYDVHTSPTVPNFDSGDTTKLEKGHVIAIEPFATDGIGLIEEKGYPSVFMLTGKKSVRIGFVRDILKLIESYEGLPFTTRWLTRRFSKGQVEYALNQLDQLGILHKFPPLVEKTKGLVSQAEHSVYVDDECIILTRL